MVTTCCPIASPLSNMQLHYFLSFFSNWKDILLKEHAPTVNYRSLGHPPKKSPEHLTSETILNYILKNLIRGEEQTPRRTLALGSTLNLILRRSAGKMLLCPLCELLNSPQLINPSDYIEIRLNKNPAFIMCVFCLMANPIWSKCAPFFSLNYFKISIMSSISSDHIYSN